MLMRTPTDPPHRVCVGGSPAPLHDSAWAGALAMVRAQLELHPDDPGLNAAARELQSALERSTEASQDAPRSPDHE